MAWTPRSGRETAGGLSWLPRMLDKARRCAAAPSERLVDGYCYGDNDFIDKQLLAFLRTDDATVSELVTAYADDADVVRMVIERSGRSSVECAAFNAAFKRKNFDFVLVEADEGRLGNGPKAAFLKFVYNNGVMRIAYPLFRRDEQARAANPTG